MEIMDYLKGRWLPVLIVVPIFAAGVAGFGAYSQMAPSVQATGTVAVSQAVGNGSTLGQFVDDFRSALGPTGLRTIVGNGGDVQVSAHGKTQADAVGHLQDGVRAGLVSLAEGQQQQAQVDRSSAQTLYSDSLAKLTDLETKNDVRDVTEQFRAYSQNIFNERNNIAQNAFNTGYVQALKAELAQDTEARNRYAAVLTEDQQLQAQLAASSGQLSNAEGALALAQARLDQVTKAPQIRRTTVVQQSAASSVIRAAVIAGVLAFIILITLILGSARIGGRSEASSAASPNPGDPDPEAGHGAPSSQREEELLRYGRR